MHICAFGEHIGISVYTHVGAAMTGLPRPLSRHTGVTLSICHLILSRISNSRLQSCDCGLADLEGDVSAAAAPLQRWCLQMKEVPCASWGGHCDGL